LGKYLQVEKREQARLGRPFQKKKEGIPSNSSLDKKKKKKKHGRYYFTLRSSGKKGEKRGKNRGACARC